MKKRYVMTLTCLVVGVVMLTTAVLANASNMSAYSTYKEAGKKLIFTNNCTLDITMEETLNGVLNHKNHSLHKYADGNQSIITTNTGLKGDENTYATYYQDGYSVHGPNENNKYFAYKMPEEYRKSNQFGVSSDNTKKTEQMVRFAELAGDALIGDIRNNFTMTDLGNGEKQVDLTLSGPQIPELLNLGLSIISVDRGFSSYDSDSNTIYEPLVEDVSISSVVCTGTVDKDGNISSGKMDLKLSGKDKNGKVNEINLIVKGIVSDVGSTVPDKIDLNGSNVEIEKIEHPEPVTVTE